MRRVKRRIFYGDMCDQEVYSVGDRTVIQANMQLRPRFKTEEERAKHRDHIARVRHNRRFMATYGPQSLYSTLTFDRENEVHSYLEAKAVCSNFMRCLRRASPDAQLSIYIGRGKRTHRIHFHMVSNGLTAEQIEAKWLYGKVERCDHLRAHNFYDGVDRGTDYTALANYLFDHWEPDQGGHRCHSTRNLNEPEVESPTEAVRAYSIHKPPQPPKGYKLIDAKGTEYGYLLYRYVRITEKPVGSRHQFHDGH